MKEKEAEVQQPIGRDATETGFPVCLYMHMCVNTHIAHVDAVEMTYDTAARHSVSLERDSDREGLIADRPAPAAICFHNCLTTPPYGSDLPIWPVHLLSFLPP